jgi:hypothetical protein
VIGQAVGNGYGVLATSNSSAGLHATTTSGYAAALVTNYDGMFGVYSVSSRVGVYGTSLTGVQGIGTRGVHGISHKRFGTGVRGEAPASDGIGVWGIANAPNGFGVYGVSAQGYAGFFFGRVLIAGSVFKSGGGFQIDHPLDPANRYLRHSFVESPDMLNIYSGNIVSGADGEAVVTLPPYFEALNRDFRYQLTVIGEFAQAIVAEEIRDGAFRIRTDRPNIRVSWQVTGIRQDAFARAHPVVPEIDKPEEERGTYLSPREHGQPDAKGALHERIRAGETDMPPQVMEVEEKIRPMIDRSRAILERERRKE